MNVDECVDRLNAAYGSTWQIWQTALGAWVIQCRKGESVKAPRLSEVLEKAAAYRVLPRYPRRPGSMSIDEFRVAKEGRRWQAVRGDFVLYTAKTKKHVESVIRSIIDKNNVAIDEWDAEYGPLIAGKTPGIDFRWQD